jgi:hypothetical protein
MRIVCHHQPSRPALGAQLAGGTLNRSRDANYVTSAEPRPRSDSAEEPKDASCEKLGCFHQQPLIFIIGAALLTFAVGWGGQRRLSQPRHRSQ